MSVPGYETRILFVENDIVALALATELLENEGFLVLAAPGAEQALAVSAVTAPDLLISDWRLEGSMNGAELAKQLQHTYEVPVILVTGHALEPLRQQTLDMDVHRYMRKPISFRELVREIHSALGRA